MRRPSSVKINIEGTCDNEAYRESTEDIHDVPEISRENYNDVVERGNDSNTDGEFSGENITNDRAVNEMSDPVVENEEIRGENGSNLMESSQDLSGSHKNETSF